MEEVVDGLDNLTFRVDSLSVITGKVNTRRGTNLPLWIVTDSGAMTQLIQRKYVEGMRFDVDDIPRSQQFNISSPGGGQGTITQRVQLEITFRMWKSDGDDSETGVQDGDREMQIRMPFGVVDELPYSGEVNRCEDTNVMTFNNERY